MAKNLFSLYKLAVGSSLSFRSLQTGTSGDHCQPSPPSSVAGNHVSPGGYMRGDVYREPNKPLPSEQFHIPRPKSNEILVKTKACGVCHSNFHVMKREIPFASPCVIGHEITVVEHGPLTDHKIIARAMMIYVKTSLLPIEPRELFEMVKLVCFLQHDGKFVY